MPLPVVLSFLSSPSEDYLLMNPYLELLLISFPNQVLMKGMSFKTIDFDQL